MPRDNVVTQQVARPALVPVLTAPTIDGDVIDCGRVALMVKNSGAAAHDVTVQTPVTVDGLAVEDLIVSVAAGATALIGPLPARTFGQPAASVDAGRAYVDYVTPADFTRAVIAL